VGVVVSFIERGGWWVIAQVLLFGLYALALLGTEGITEGIGLDFARLVGIGMVVAAVVIGTWSFVVLGRNLTIYPYPVHQATLTDRGPYRLVRHPIYLSVIVGGVGLALAWLNTAGVLVALVFIPFFSAKTGFEEDGLVEHVPGYREYRSAIPYRIIPWVM
jgi:protein-S-isoprenylcysteine O-methyltransferase Ste14